MAAGRAVVVGAVLLALSACSAGTSSDVTKIRDQASVATGGDLFKANCARCHGSNLQGGPIPGGGAAPSLAGLVGSDDVILVEIVERGRGLQMPSFATQLEETEIVSIIDYVRSVQAIRLANEED